MISFTKKDESGIIINIIKLLCEIQNMYGTFGCILLISGGVLRLLFLLCFGSLISVIFVSEIGWCGCLGVIGPVNCILDVVLALWLLLPGVILVCVAVSEQQ